MPSVNDVYNQLVTANTTLDQIHADLVTEESATQQVNTSVNQLDSDLKSGFQAIEARLTILQEYDIDTVKLLFHLTQQADTIICALEKISKNTCEMLNQATLQTALQRRIRDDADVVRDITEFAHPRATLERERLGALRTEIEKCCPPEPPQPVCTYEPCPRPESINEPELPPSEDR
jgi:hypothetical protein